MISNFINFISGNENNKIIADNYFYDKQFINLVLYIDVLKIVDNNKNINNQKNNINDKCNNNKSNVNDFNKLKYVFSYNTFMHKKKEIDNNALNMSLVFNNNNNISITTDTSTNKRKESLSKLSNNSEVVESSNMFTLLTINSLNLKNPIYYYKESYFFLDFLYLWINKDKNY